MIHLDMTMKHFTVTKLKIVLHMYYYIKCRVYEHTNRHFKE